VEDTQEIAAALTGGDTLLTTPEMSVPRTRPKPETRWTEIIGGRIMGILETVGLEFLLIGK
jgi:hypothetical protein